MAISYNRLIRTLYAASACCAVAAVGLLLPRASRMPELQREPAPVDEPSELPALCEAFGKLAQRQRQLKDLIVRQAPECRPYLSDFRDAASSRR